MHSCEWARLLAAYQPGHRRRQRTLNSTDCRLLLLACLASARNDEEPATAAGGARITGCRQGRSRQGAGWWTVGQIVAWVCLIVVIALVVGHALQIATENTVTRADGTELTEGMDIGYTRGTCSALDRHVNRTMTLDELRDLQDQWCPDLSEPQHSANS